LQPADADLYLDGNYTDQQLGAIVNSHGDPAESVIALLGVKEGRGSVKNHGCAEAPDNDQETFILAGRVQTNIKDCRPGKY
jgi:hypothetical protein